MYRKSTRCLSTLLSGCLLLLSLSACEPRQQLFEQRILEFGTIIDISIIHHDANKTEQTLFDIEKQLQLYRSYWHAWEDSDLFRFNRSLSQSSTSTVPESLLELIKLSEDFYLPSQKLFNPAIGKLIAAYGFHGNQLADEPLIEIIRKNMPTMANLEINGNLARSSNPHLQLDFGGIAKGYAMAKIARKLKKSGFEHYLINIGGDVLIAGKRFNQPWVIAIQNPFAPGAIASIKLSGNQQLFTSGNYQRYYRKQDEIIHHIIDPRSGQPSSQMSSATVLTTDAVLADVAATTMMIDGWNHHESLSNSLGVSDYMIVNDNMDIIVSRSLSKKIDFLIDDTNIVIY